MVIAPGFDPGFPNGIYRFESYRGIFFKFGGVF